MERADAMVADRAAEDGPDSPGRALLMSLSMAQFMVVLDFTIVNVALPSIQLEFHVATSTSQWLVSAYAVAFGGLLLLGGRLADVAGRARMYRLGLVVFVAGSISGGLALEPDVLIASRIVQGVGAALLAPAALSLLVTSWPDDNGRARALGVYGAVVSSGFAAGAILGGALVEATWRLVFFVNVPIGFGLLITSWRLLPPDQPSPQRRADIAGAATITAGVALLVLAVSRAGDTLKLTQPALLAGLGLGLLGVFVVQERRAVSPLVDLTLFDDRRLVGANLSIFGLGAIVAAEVLLLTLYLQDGRGLSALLAGLCFAPQAAGGFMLSRPASRLVNSSGPRRAMALAMGVGVVALGGAALAVGAGSLIGLLAAVMVVGMISRVAQVAGTLSGTSGPAAARSEGTASALLTATRQSGAALGVAIASATLAAAHGTTAHRSEIALFVTAGFALEGLLATLLIPAKTGAHPIARIEHRFSHHAGGLA
jgi:EmrB/QacA subfamily drug resistance transporter